MHQPTPLILVIIFFSACYAVNFSPDPDAGMVSVSVDETSLQNLLSVYENAGYHDLGTAKKNRRSGSDEASQKISTP